ncbi:RagB/SusD family nutrient uptake outer membrane protein [Reichenbachiella sp. MALMAid0571]|uniref:RagB/SusD family nutrient uptake outer membrane protein n=1 Tax=Reichenbachiella sp. MALMAid0571 TaxID=3143939 RepID=UPI0032DF993C
MKIYKKWQVFATAVLMLSSVGCSDFLDEEAVSLQTAENYYVTPEGFEDLVKSTYPLLRNLIRDRELVMQGTDIFSQGDWSKASTTIGSSFNEYDANLSPSTGEVETLWNRLYLEINRTNTVVSRAEGVVGMDEALKEDRVAEAKVLRALALFYAVQQWGDIPMPLEETTTGNKEVIRVPAADVYTQIISDLTAAEATLPVTATDYGRVTKGTAQFLLARVYLTRGWNYNNSLGGSNADFGMALDYADKIIAAYPLAANYNDLFPKRNENPLLETNNPGTQNAKNDEIVFAIQFSDNVQTNGLDNIAETGNDYHHPFGGGTDVPGEVARSSYYNRYLGKFIPTPSIYRMYDTDIDTRYNHNFLGRLYALIDVPNFTPKSGVTPINISAGEVVVEFRPWDNPATTSAERGMDVGGDLRYAVINTDEFQTISSSAYHGNNAQPLMWKFFEPNIEYGDGFGTFDFALFRSAEAYLIAAEAIVKGATGGDLGGAEVYYNRVVDRALGANAGATPLQAADPADVSSMATVSYRATAGTINIDMILDERARELMGEYMRWYDLKRTGKLIDRAKAMNPWTTTSGLAAHHYLRPIPQQEIDLASNELSQNPDYN